MPVTVAEFRAKRPEFGSGVDELVPDSVIQTELDNAAAHLAEMDLFDVGPLLDMAQSLRAAHQLAISPFGKSARMVTKEGRTTYQEQFDRIWLTAIGGV